jgi:hypothetical protein
MSSKPNGFIAHRGPSMINGAPTRVIVTGTAVPTENRKTDDMEQVWILPDNIKPTEAAKSGADAAVCGDCSHRPMFAKARGVAPCYVNLGQAPHKIFEASYPTIPTTRGVPRRLGAFGDPAAMPYETALELAPGDHTGYTHQWRTCDQRFRHLCMASVDTEQEATEAQAMGWRTFRVRPQSEADAPLMAGEINCPASKEAGYRAKCAQCLLCAGTSRKAKNIAILAHGRGAKR